jgi:hypothetical protein
VCVSENKSCSFCFFGLFYRKQQLKMASVEKDGGTCAGEWKAKIGASPSLLKLKYDQKLDQYTLSFESTLLGKIPGAPTLTAVAQPSPDRLWYWGKMYGQRFFRFQLNKEKDLVMEMQSDCSQATQASGTPFKSVTELWIRSASASVVISPAVGAVENTTTQPSPATHH